MWSNTREERRQTDFCHHSCWRYRPYNRYDSAKKRIAELGRGQHGTAEEHIVVHFQGNWHVASIANPIFSPEDSAGDIRSLNKGRGVWLGNHFKIGAQGIFLKPGKFINTDGTIIPSNVHGVESEQLHTSSGANVLHAAPQQNFHTGSMVHLPLGQQFSISHSLSSTLKSCFPYIIQ